VQILDVDQLGSGGFNLLNLGAKYCHLLDMHEHIKKPVSKNLTKFKGKFKYQLVL